MQEAFLMFNPVKDSPPGQEIVETAGPWKVPPGVTFLSVVTTGRGAAWANASNNTYGGGGGGLSWRNNIPVTPGETLTIVIDAASTRVLRGSTFLCGAGAGNYTAAGLLNIGRGGIGGKAFNELNDGGYNGGQGTTYLSGTGQACAGGGAAGYQGNGGNGNGGNPAANSGAGAGGLHNGTQGGGGVGLKGLGNTGVYPSGPGSGGVATKYAGGGGRNVVPGVAGVRFMWGDERTYPLNAPDV